MIDKLLCLGNEDEAVGMLLESTAAMDSSDPRFYEYNLRAFLISACQQQKKEFSNEGIYGFNSTTKLVATNLIAEGKLWEGVQLLCLIGKVTEACQYLQSSGEWDASVWLAKCRLNNARYICRGNPITGQHHPGGKNRKIPKCTTY